MPTASSASSGTTGRRAGGDRPRDEKTRPAGGSSETVVEDPREQDREHELHVDGHPHTRGVDDRLPEDRIGEQGAVGVGVQREPDAMTIG